MAVKFISADGWGSDTGAAQAVEYAAKMGATVANSSWGGEGWSQPLYDIFKATADMGLLHVVAAGNDGKDLRTYHQVPAIFHVPGQLTVSALYEANIYMPFWSNYGSDDSDLSCAGADVYSTVPGKSYRPLSGTSMASPGIAGDVALIKSHRPGISYQEIHRLLDKYSISDKDSMRKVRFQGRPNMLKVFGDL